MTVIASERCPHGCNRLIQHDFRQRAEGRIQSHSATVTFVALLPEEFCRFCSRALTGKADALGEVNARPRQREIGELVPPRRREKMVRM